MLEKLESAIDKTVKQFQKHPFDFLSERDIQAWLFAELRLRDATSNLLNSYDASHDVANSRFKLISPFSIHRVKTEYHVPIGIFDVAVLSDKPDSTKNIWRQPCRVGIEIKLWQPRERKPNYDADVQKLQNYQKYLQESFTEGRSFTGIAMLFVHPCPERTASPISEESSGDPYPEDGVALHYGY